MSGRSVYRYGLLLIALTAALHQYAQKVWGWKLPYLHAYLDDVLCVPLFAALWRWERQCWWGQARITDRELFLFVLLIFIIFEGIVPRYSPHFTADWWDGAAYAVGGWLYRGLQQRAEFGSA